MGEAHGIGLKSAHLNSRQQSWYCVAYLQRNNSKGPIIKCQLELVEKKSAFHSMWS